MCVSLVCKSCVCKSGMLCMCKHCAWIYTPNLGHHKIETYQTFDVAISPSERQSHIIVNCPSFQLKLFPPDLFPHNFTFNSLQALSWCFTGSLVFPSFSINIHEQWSRAMHASTPKAILIYLRARWLWEEERDRTFMSLFPEASLLLILLGIVTSDFFEYSSIMGV